MGNIWEIMNDKIVEKYIFEKYGYNNITELRQIDTTNGILVSFICEKMGRIEFIDNKDLIRFRRKVLINNLINYDN